MPNDCWNHITITCEDQNQLKRLVKNELQEMSEDKTFVYHETIEMIKRGVNGIIFRKWSPWNPNYEWLEELLTKYPECWIKNEWDEEGGMAGVWVGFTNENGEKMIKQMTWDDLCIEAKHYLFLEEPEQAS
jgi:hypothetical protein